MDLANYMKSGHSADAASDLFFAVSSGDPAGLSVFSNYPGMYCLIKCF